SAVRLLSAGSNVLSRLARMRDALHQLAAALCAPLDLALTRKPHEVLPLALAHGMAVLIDA
ncbi:MAG: hypothetical protein ACRDQE_15820, partial [Gaiellales bacterium]